MNMGLNSLTNKDMTRKSKQTLIKTPTQLRGLRIILKMLNGNCCLSTICKQFSNFLYTRDDYL